MKYIFTVLLGFAWCTVSLANPSFLPSVKDTSMIYDFPEQMASFPGGPDAMDEFIRKNIEIPAELVGKGEHGKVYIEFIVEKDGSLTNVGVRMSTNNKLNESAVRVVNKMPNWVPGTMRNKSVRVKQTVPIVFAAT
jgi:protein TonB